MNSPDFLIRFSSDIGFRSDSHWLRILEVPVLNI
jgi:hypothetical protein